MNEHERLSDDEILDVLNDAGNANEIRWHDLAAECLARGRGITALALRLKAEEDAHTEALARAERAEGQVEALTTCQFGCDCGDCWQCRNRDWLTENAAALEGQP